MTHPIAAYLARCALHTRALHPAPTPLTIGQITLLPHQVAAVHWLQHRITHFGGALLADPPGLGKTYVALAIAARRQCTPLVVAPAALRERWHHAATESGMTIVFISTERLSAPAAIRDASSDFVIIDEAHHLRTASTRRYQRTATLCATADVLLLTATPIHNHPHDVARITALFHLPTTRQTPATLRRLTLRRTLAQIHAAGLTDAQPLSIPTVCLRPIRTLPPRGEQLSEAILRITRIDDTTRHGHRLLQLGLLHALRSSDAACRAQVRNRIAATIAIEQAALARVHPSAAIRRAFATRDGDIQLALTPLLVLGGAGADDLSDLARQGARQREDLRALLPLLDGRHDRCRATSLRRMARWCRHPVVAFTQFSATAESFYRALCTRPGIALLSGTQARIASGVVSRDEVLHRLLARDRQHHQIVRMLITTDVLSEGLSLAGVATIVHLDLPWTAARIDQRIGRAARIGSPRPTVRVMTLPASVPQDLATRLHSLLDGKRRAMQDFAERTGNDAAHVALLRELATTGPKRASGGWIAVRSALVHVERIIALASLRGRPTLLVVERGRLRAPGTADWLALRDAAVTQVPRGARLRLRAAIRSHLSERELREVVQLAGDQRLQARRALDDQIRLRDPVSRIAAAADASQARVDVMQPTRAAAMPSPLRRAVNTGSHGPADTEGGQGVVTPASTSGRRRQELDVRRRSVRAAVVLLPR